MTLITHVGTANGIRLNSSGITFTVFPNVNEGGIAIILAGWVGETVNSPAVTWDGSSATLISAIAGNDDTLKLGLYSFSDPTTAFGVGNAQVAMSFDTTVSFIIYGVASFSGTTVISTATITYTTGASTLIGTTVSGVTPFSYLFAAVAGTRSTNAVSFTTAHSSMISIVGTFGATTNLGWTMAYSKSLSGPLTWNSSAESSFVAIGFALDPEASIVDITPGRITPHFHVVLED